MSVLTRILSIASERAAPGTGLVCDGRLWSYREIEECVRRASATLARAGIAPGDRVALHLRNSLELVVCYFACFMRGATAVPVNTRFRSRELEYVLQHSGATMYVGHRALCRDLSIAPPRIRHTILLDRQDDVLTDLNVLLADDVSTPAPISVDPDQPAVILYTSGTTAKPKGVVHTQDSLGHVATLGSASLFRPDDIVGIPSLMVHAAGLLALLSSVCGRRKAVVMSGEADVVAGLVKRHRVTAMLGLPATYWELLEAQRRQPRALASLRSPIVCGDVISSRLKERFEAECGCELKPHYGMTEAFPITYSHCRPAEVGLLGQPISGVEIRTVDQRGRDLALGDVGEIEIRSPAMMVGYWDAPDATRDALQDGWLRTGDLGFRDAAGYLWLTGRKRDVIVRGGSKIAPAEIEDVLLAHSDIQEAAVFGAPDATMGEIVAAAVVPRPGAVLDSAGLMRFVRDRLSDYKVPEALLVVDRLPRTSAGKVDRRELRACAIPIPQAASGVHA